MQISYFNITYRCNSNCIFCAANHPLWKDDSEMSLEEFKKILDERNVTADDRVIVNGGEPTVHRDFWGILDAIASRGAKIDLYTNGIRLANEIFAQKLLTYSNMHIRIPLFGATPETHDKLTGNHGNFAATTAGLDWLYKHLHGSVTLEIKLLLSRATVPENEAIYELYRSRWNHEAVRVSLNPLLLSECVIQQKDLMIDTYENMMIQSEPLIRRALADGTDFSVALVPYCSFPNHELLNTCRGRRNGGKHLYAAPGYKKNVDSLNWRQECANCCLVGECNGFPKNYIDYFGKEAIRPIMEI